jgi:signal transduction histidine kinase
MGDRDVEKSRGVQRDQTDESLRAERHKADDAAAQQEAMEAVAVVADEVVRVARLRADEVVQTARDRADSKHLLPRAAAAVASTDRERTNEDLVLEGERSRADAVLERQRFDRKRYLADFLAVEREATDRYLVDERQDADTAIAARDEFLATVSHDLRSLLGGLSLSAELLWKQAPAGPGGDRVRTQAGTHQRLIARMNRLLNDLLDITSIEAGKLDLTMERFDVANILRDTVDAFQPIAAAKGIVLECDAEEPTRGARLDEGRMLQVLANLVANAIKFTPADGRVSIRSRWEGSDLHLSVSDTGIGIPESALTAVFERFHQVRKDRCGLGLGLHISRCIVEGHGGRMWAESKVAVGSTFHVVVPAEGAAPAEESSPPPPAADVVLPGASR